MAGQRGPGGETWGSEATGLGGHGQDFDLPRVRWELLEGCQQMRAVL